MAETVLILGAGASVPYGYPTGATLLKKIEEFPDNQEFDRYPEPNSNLLIRKCAKKHTEDTSTEDPHDCKSIVKFCDSVSEYIKKFGLNSINIDRFLKDNPEFYNLGTRMIAYQIMNCARFGAGEFPNDNGWYDWILKHIVEHDKDIRNKLAIVTFNYDVSLEAFLSTKLCRGESTTFKAKELYESLEIIHVYGKLANTFITQNSGLADCLTHGGYEFENVRAGYALGHGEWIAWTQADKPATNLRTIYSEKHEEVCNSPHMCRARELILNARRLVFIGFGFDEENLKLLGETTAREIYCTNFENDEHISQIVSEWANVPQDKICFRKEGIDIINALPPL